MQLTRSQADEATATDYNVAPGTTLIGDLQLCELMTGCKHSWCAIGWQPKSGIRFKVYQTDISNKVLLQNVVLALGANTVPNYEE